MDSAGFLSCYADQASVANTCAANCTATFDKNKDTEKNDYNVCIIGCNQPWYAGNIGCWLESCWNQVSLLALRVEKVGEDG